MSTKGKTKVFLIISRIDKSKAFELMARFVNKDKFSLTFVLLNERETNLEQYLVDHAHEVYRIGLNSQWSRVMAFIKLFLLFTRKKPHVVHAHLFDAGLVGITAAWLCKIKKRIYTRHYSTFHHNYHPKGVHLDKWINDRSTDIVAISENVKKVLTNYESVPAKKVHLIHHGFDLEKLRIVPEDRIRGLKTKYSLNQSDSPIIGVVSRYIELKGIQYIIPAFKLLLESHPNAKLVLANASGDYKNNIQDLLTKLPKNSYIEIPFEEDMEALYLCFDVFIHVPKDRTAEAFGQTYVESLASGIPSVFTLSGIASEFIIDGFNALVVNYQCPKGIYESIMSILNDKSLKESLISNGLNSVKKFSFDQHLAKTEEIYA